MTKTGRMSADAAIGAVKSGDVVVAPLSPGGTDQLLQALCARMDELADITLVGGDLEGAYSCLGSIPEKARGRLKLRILAGSRPRSVIPSLEWAPLPFFEITRLFIERVWKVDVCLLPLTPPDDEGQHRISPTLAWLADAAGVARTVIAEVNPGLPVMKGDNGVQPSRLDAWVESGAPAPSWQYPPIQGVHRAIARNVAELIPDGACLQLGIGTMIEAVLAELAAHKNLGLHTGTVPDGIIPLVKSGVLNNARNPSSKGVIATTSVRGSQYLYDFVNRNPDVQLRGPNYVHNAQVISQIPDFVAINSALSVDLYGQVTAETIDGKMRSSGAGQMDFMRAARLAPGGRTIIMLPATGREGESRIVARLAAGDLVTTHRADVDYVVTEYGVAKLRGATLENRALRLASIAHPTHRDRLLAGLPS